MSSLLQLEHVEAIYDGIILGIKDISLSVAPQSITGLLGANGAGKSTTLKAISALLQAERGKVTHGRIDYQGHSILEKKPAEIVASGLCQVLEGRHCFGHLTIEENLLTGAFIKSLNKAELAQQLEKLFHFFPRLKLLRKRQAGYISGGEQQMLAIARALMSSPKLVLLDEPSMGLAPQIVEEIFEILHVLRKQEQMSFLIAEQNAALTLHYADYLYVLENGVTHHSGTPAQLEGVLDLAAAYLGQESNAA